MTKVLAKYLPAETVEICGDWIVKLNIHLRITKNRASKFGDYRPLQKGEAHQITINTISILSPSSSLLFTKSPTWFVKKNIPKNISSRKEWKHEYAILLNTF